MRVDRMIDTLELLHMENPNAEVGIVEDVVEEGIVTCLRFSLRVDHDLILLATESNDARIDQWKAKKLRKEV